MEGKSLSDPMAKQPRIFSDLYINMVRAGGTRRRLVESATAAGDHFERFSQVQSKFTSGAGLPSLRVGGWVVIMFFFMTYMLPKKNS